MEQRLAVRDTANEPERPERPSTANDRRSILVTAGDAKDLAADFVWREDQYELDRLELRDMAIREGWFGDERYRDEVGRLEGRRPDLRTEVDDDVYDRYLFAVGEDNRVRVRSAIPGSPAEAAGVGVGW